MSLQEQLHQLFLMDQQIRGMSRRLVAAQVRQKAQQAKLGQLQQQRKELADQLKQGQAKAAGLEHQVRDADARINKLRDQMNGVKSHKEYQALSVEVGTLKVEKSKVEDVALEQMGKVDALKQDLTALDQRLAEQQKLVALAETEVAAARSEVGQQLDALQTQRAASEQQLPEEARNVYAKTSDLHEGEAMAGVIEESRRHMEYTCGGCYMSIPVEKVNALMVHQDQIVICPSCNRILFMDPQLKTSLSDK